ncbi:carboxypeptidase regulatory-like domain-containing protein [bacterium]|nr:carboxypeptidase regulatory-like domain-containing protein [bacterium]
MKPVLDTSTKRQLSAALLSITLLCLAACGGGNGQPELTAASSPLPAHERLETGQLPGLPLGDPQSQPDRNLSFTNIVSYNGNGIFNASPNCLFPNNSIVLPSMTAETAWALYAFNTGGYQPERLSVDITCNPGSVAYVAVSDYQAGRWQWQSPTDGPASYDLPEGLYLNSLTQFYVAVLTSGGSSATVKSLSVRFDNDVIYDHSVSGTILDEHGEPLASQFIFVSPNPDNVTLVTDVDGSFLIGLPTAGMYSFEPQSMNVSYSPPTQNVNVSGAVQDIDFTGTRIDISGRVATADGVGVPGISITLNPGAIMTTVSGADGEYSFEGIANGSYSVDPLQAGYTFNPASENVNVSGTDVGGVDFESTGGQPSYAISGNINDGSNPVAGVAITLTPGFRLAFTDVNGNYSFSNLAPAQYDLKPALGKWTFNPVVRLVNLGNANENGIDFTGTAPPPEHSGFGKVVWDDNGTLYGIPGIRVDVYDINAAPVVATAYSGSDGSFEVTGLVEGTYYARVNSLVYKGDSFYLFTISGIDGFIGNVETEFKAGGPTWDNWAASYVSNSCTSCHRPDSQTAVDPPLRTLTEVANTGSACNARIQNGTMPPGNPSSDLNKRYFQIWRLASYPEDEFPMN